MCVCVCVCVGGGWGWEWICGCTGPSNADLVAVIKLLRI